MTLSELAYIQAYYYACGRNDALPPQASSGLWRDPSAFAQSYADEGSQQGHAVRTWWERGPSD